MPSVDNLSYEYLLEWADLVSRTIRNKDISPIYRLLYLGLVDTYPEILRGEKIPVQVWRIREAAGWAHKNSARDFLTAMQEIHALTYDPGAYRKKEEDRIGSLTANTEIFPFPESFNTRQVDSRRKAREEEEKRRKQFKNPLQIMQCEECGSNNLTWEATPTCQDCHHIHSTIKDIPASAITIDAEIIEIEDDIFLDEPTERVPVVPKTPRVAITQAELPAAPAVQFGKHPRNIACVDCGASNHWYAVTAEWGGTLHRCGICMPPEGGPHR